MVGGDTNHDEALLLVIFFGAVHFSFYLLYHIAAQPCFFRNIGNAHTLLKHAAYFGLVVVLQYLVLARLVAVIVYGAGFIVGLRVGLTERLPNKKYELKASSMTRLF